MWHTVIPSWYQRCSCFISMADLIQVQQEALGLAHRRWRAKIVAVLHLHP